MNNVNIDFNFKYPGKKERVIYTVTSILKDEIRLFGKSIISAILVCVCFENGWILPQEHCGNDDFMIVMFSIFCFMLINENTFLWFKTAAIVSYKNNNLKSIFNDVIQEINKITIDEKALPQDKFRNPYVVCLEYLSKYGYSIKTIEWE